MNRKIHTGCTYSVPASGRRALANLFALLGICVWGLSADAAIPPRPAEGEFFHDLAAIVNAGDAQKIQNLQQEVFRQSATPIVVVTIKRMRDYDPESPSIESFARRWFDTWGIGTQAKNDGMLVLVSTEDRKARIELGAAWERRFDEFSKRLMDRKMVPEFKKGHYGTGLLAAVRSLAEIAKAGPKADPPNPSLTERILENPVMVFSREHNPIREKVGSLPILLMVIAGLGCLFAAIWLPDYRKALVITGLILIGLAVLFYIVIAIIVLWAKATGKIQVGGGGSSDGGGGGGGFGGGSSGGGGASGSW